MRWLRLPFVALITTSLALGAMAVRAAVFVVSQVGSVSPASPMLEARADLVGGRGDDVTASAELYDPKTGRFTETGSLHTARYKHAAGLLPDGRVLIVGGSDDRDWHGALRSAEIYDPHTERFTATSSLNDSRFKLPKEAVELASGQMVISGGSQEVEVYDPKSGKFLVASGRMNDAWHYMSETGLRDGRVLIAGGYPDSDRATAQTWIYRP